MRALDGLSLSVRSGGVFGFLGPNGSGKTTTIRCLLGLARPDTGHCRVLGAECPTGLPEVIARVGALVETPGVNPGMSGRRTLTVLATTVGIGRSAVEATLERVGLADRADDLVRGYSLGMRQRLGIGIALLKDPELLILDEPANGLDPAGIREVRELIGGLGAEGRTVFLSSHLLSEVEQVCTEVAIVAAGHTVAHGSVADVLASTRPAAMWVKVGDLAAGAETLRRAGFGVGANGDRLRVEVAVENAEFVTRALVADGHYPTELRPGGGQSRGRLLRVDRTARERRRMIRLLAAEVQRIAARRLVRLTVVLALAGVVFGGVAAFVWSDSLSEATYQQRVTEAKAREVQQREQIDNCLAAHGVAPGTDIPDDVARQCFPTKDAGHVDDARFHRNRLRGVLQGTVGTLVVVGWALGASLAGAEFASTRDDDASDMGDTAWPSVHRQGRRRRGRHGGLRAVHSGARHTGDVARARPPRRAAPA